MKAMNGLEVLSRAKDYFPGINIVFYTAGEDLGVAIKAMKSGSFDFLIKHKTTGEELNSVLESLCLEAVGKIL